MDAPIYPLHEVFVLSGTPEHTFVQPVEYIACLLRCVHPAAVLLSKDLLVLEKLPRSTKQSKRPGLEGPFFPYRRARKTT